MIWHISWHSIWHFSAILSDILLDIFMTCYLISISHIFWHSISHVLTSSYLTVYLAFHLAFYLAMCSGPAAQRVGELADWQRHLPWRGGGKIAGCTWLGVCVCGHVCGRVSPGCLVNLKNLTGGEWSYPTSGSWETSVPNPSIGWSSFLLMLWHFLGEHPIDKQIQLDRNVHIFTRKQIERDEWRNGSDRPGHDNQRFQRY